MTLRWPRPTTFPQWRTFPKVRAPPPSLLRLSSSLSSSSRPPPLALPSRPPTSTPHALTDLVVIFDEYDENKNGYLSAVELRKLLVDLDFTCDDVSLSAMMRRVDSSNDGQIDMLELVEG